MESKTNAPSEKTTWFNEFGHLTDSEIKGLDAAALKRYLDGAIAFDDDNAPESDLLTVDKPAPFQATIKTEPVVSFPITAAKPESVKPKTPAITGKTIDDVPNDILIEKSRKICLHAIDKDGEFTNENKKLLRTIGKILTKRNVKPIDRKYISFKGVDFERQSVSRCRNALAENEIDFLNICVFPDGNDTDDTSEMMGMFESMFIGAPTDWEKVERVAVGEYTNAAGKLVNLTKERKIKGLMLPDYAQEQCVIFRTEAIRKKVERKQKAKREEEKRLNDIKRQAMDVRHKLVALKENPKSRVKDIDIDECVNVWVAIRHSGGDLKDLVGIIGAYKNLTGESILKPRLQRRITSFKKHKIL